MMFAVCAVALIGVTGCGNKTPASATNGAVAPASISDVEFAKTNFTALTEGDTAIESAIDWNTFQTSGIKVGEIYAKMPDENQKSAFRKSFITSFSNSFKSSGAKAGDVKNWRVEKETPAQTTVIGNVAAGKNISVTLSKSGGQQKITALEVK